MLERLRLTQPNLDTKPGTVSRDLFIDMQADQLERLHTSVALVAEKQSPDSATGKDLDRWARNFGIVKSPGTPSNGIVVFSTNQIIEDIQIPAGTVVSARNGLNFKTIGNFVMSAAERGKFSATANRISSALNVVGITDNFAIEIPVSSNIPGTSGNIASYQIIDSNLEDAMNITNITSFNGGANQESDAVFRSRVFSVFSGSNTGTEFGYRNAGLSVSGVNDAIVITPGNTLMLRDGTETIQVNDGSFRILNSGTGGKVDLYILGTQLEEFVESYIYTDKSGTGNPTDDRNDYILGQGTLDRTLTSEERRLRAFRQGILPAQPADSVISITGTSSGILAEAFTDADGNLYGNYQLLKDLNPETGGSPFGFDKIRFISGEKEVSAENIIKKSINSIDALRFSNIDEILNVYQDIFISSENSKVLSSDRRVIQLSHSPALTVSRVRNFSTGEIYTIQSQNIDPETGLNLKGEIVISGKTLPSPSDVLSVDYTWRLFYDKYIDYNGEFNASQALDSEVGDSVDWGTSAFIASESSVVERTEDDLEYRIVVENDISRVISAHSIVSTSGAVSQVVENGLSVFRVTIPSSQPVIDNIISIKTSDGLELYNTLRFDGSFSNRVITLPSDSPVDNLSDIIVKYNKFEIYNIQQSDGSFSNNIINLPSENFLQSIGILQDVRDLFLTQDEVFIDYVAEINNIVSSISLSSLPISGSDGTNKLLNSSLSTISSSNQPLFFEYDIAGDPLSIMRFGPSRLSVNISGSTRAGKIRASGETLTRMSLQITAGNSINGRTFNLASAIAGELSLSSIPNNIGIARVDSIESLDSSKTFDLLGQKVNNSRYALGFVAEDALVNRASFVIPPTSANSSLSYTPGERLVVNVLIYNNNDFEDLFFQSSGRVITNKVFARVSSISVSSGFRSPGGSLLGTISVLSQNQPGVGDSYFANYKFSAPVEGERLTIRYNINRLIQDVTANLENVRSITADVLVKECPLLEVDAGGEVIINQDAIAETSSMVQNVSNAIANLLNSGTLGSTIDYSDIINAATSVPGVDSFNLSLFNESGKPGRRSSIKALDNQSIIAGEILITPVSRKDFRIT